jgi:hypothetical protein
VRIAVKARSLGGEEPRDGARGRDPPTRQSRGFEANADAIRVANAARYPSHQAAQADGLALTVRREAPARAGQWLTEAGSDLV